MSGLAELKGVGPALAGLLSKHGISSLEHVASATVEQLTAVPGIGQARAQMLISAAAALRPPAPVPQPKAKKARPDKPRKKKKKKSKKSALKTKKKKARASKADSEKSKKSEKKKSAKKGKKGKKGKKSKPKNGAKSKKK